MAGRLPTPEELTRLVVDAWLVAHGAQRPVFSGEPRTELRTLEVRHYFRNKYPKLVSFVPESDDPIVRMSWPDDFKWLPGDPTSWLHGAPPREWVAQHPERRVKKAPKS